MLYVALLHAKEMSLQNLKWEVGSASQFPGSKQDSQLSLPDIFKKKKKSNCPYTTSHTTSPTTLSKIMHKIPNCLSLPIFISQVSCN